MHDARVKRSRIVLAVGLALLALGVAGCDGDEVAAPPETTTPGDTTTSPTSETTTFAIYLLRDGLISPVRRSVAATPAVARASIEALLDGPSADERGEALDTAIPEATTLLGVSIADRVATVDLSGAFDDGDDAESLHGRVAQVVATLTQFPTVERVSIRLDGEPVTTIGDQTVDPPIGRRAIEEQTPQILIESPLPGDTVSSPIRISGTANVFEATVSLEVRDGTGTVVLEAFTTATSGTGTRGTFDTTLSVPGLEGPMTIVAFESSAEDGRPLHAVDVQVNLVR